MGGVLVFPDAVFKKGLLPGGECPVQEPLGDVGDGQRRGMSHIVCVETGVPQFIHHYFVGREIADPGV